MPKTTAVIANTFRIVPGPGDGVRPEMTSESIKISEKKVEQRRTKLRSSRLLLCPSGLGGSAPACVGVGCAAVPFGISLIRRTNWLTMPRIVTIIWRTSLFMGFFSKKQFGDRSEEHTSELQSHS